MVAGALEKGGSLVAMRGALQTALFAVSGSRRNDANTVFALREVAAALVGNTTSPP